MKYVSLIISLAFLNRTFSACTPVDKWLWSDDRGQGFSRALISIGVKRVFFPLTPVPQLFDRFPSLTIPCAECFHKNFKCGIDNCLPKCLFDKYCWDCLNCIDTKCIPQLTECAGLGVPDLPPHPINRGS